MDNFYVYAFIRDDLTPYYIGKGKDKRAYTRRSRGTRLPKDNSKIIIFAENLSEHEAFTFEKYFIGVWGRKDKKEGLLTNRTDGGEGCSGIIVSNKTRQKLRESHLGHKDSEETKIKKSDSHVGLNTWAKGKPAPRPKVECPHCNKIGGIQAMGRWHFDNCKLKGI